MATDIDINEGDEEVLAKPLGSERPEGLRTWIEISTEAIRHNMTLVKGLITPNVQIMAIVKSNAYGHDLFQYATQIVKEGATWIGVDSIVEATALRKHGLACPIFVLGYTLPERLAEAHEHDISITVSSLPALEEAIAFGKSLKVHIKIDTGLHRQGFLPEQVPQLIEKLLDAKKFITAEGVYTHFADIKRTEGIEYSKNQRASFDTVVAQFTSAGFNPITHADASPGLLRFGPMTDKLVRVGALLYGIWPAPFMREEFAATFDLKPSLSWKTIIAEIKKVPKGESVGYNRSETLTRDSIIAVCPIGYWHGYPGSLSSKGIVIVRGKPARVLGRVTMDMITIDVTDISDVQPKDVVTLIDSDQNSLTSAEKVAEVAGVSVHELLTRLNPRIKRLFY